MKIHWLIPLLFSVLARGQILLPIMAGGNNPTAATPTFSPAAGAVSNPTTVTASSSSGCSTHMYFDTSATPTTLQNTFSVTTAETVYAQVRGCPGFGDSAVGSAAYTISGGSYLYYGLGCTGTSSTSSCTAPTGSQATVDSDLLGGSFTVGADTNNYTLNAVGGYFSTPSGNFHAAVYTEAPPQALVCGDTAQASQGSSAGWVENINCSGCTLIHGTEYIIAIQPDNNTSAIGTITGSGVYLANTYGSTPSSATFSGYATQWLTYVKVTAN